MKWGLALFAVLTGCASSNRYASFDDVPYPYERERTVWSPRAGLNIRVAELGSRTSTNTPIVLLHPWGFSMAIWADVAPVLSRDRRVLLLDLPGHGKSDKLRTTYSMKRLAAAVIDVAAEAGVARFFVAGNSLGGATSIAIAEAEPERLAGMILIASPGGSLFAEPLRHAARTIATASSLKTLSDEAWYVGLLVAQRSDSKLAIRLREDLAALRDAKEWPAWCEATTSLLPVAAAYQPVLEKIAVRTLVVHGDADLLITKNASDALASRLPNAEFIELEGCGHMPETECPNVLLEHLRRFIE